jgi:hypothetical protein
MKPMRLLILLAALATAAPNALHSQTPASPDEIHRLLVLSRTLPTQAERLGAAREGERLARETLARTPGSLELRWLAIAALGSQVDEESNRRKISLTREIYDEVELLRALDPDHPGLHHALARLHSGVLRLRPILRWLAARMVGGDLLQHASWEAAETHFRRAIELEPHAILHRVELGLLLLERDREAEGRRELERVLGMLASNPLDSLFQERAAQAVAIAPNRLFPERNPK